MCLRSPPSPVRGQTCGNPLPENRLPRDGKRRRHQQVRLRRQDALFFRTTRTRGGPDVARATAVVPALDIPPRSRNRRESHGGAARNRLPAGQGQNRQSPAASVRGIMQIGDHPRLDANPALVNAADAAKNAGRIAPRRIDNQQPDSRRHRRNAPPPQSAWRRHRRDRERRPAKAASCPVWFRAFTSASAAISADTTKTWPLFAAWCSDVKPKLSSSMFTSAFSAISVSTMTTWPFRAAWCSGVKPQCPPHSPPPPPLSARPQPRHDRCGRPGAAAFRRRRFPHSQPQQRSSRHGPRR